MRALTDTECSGILPLSETSTSPTFVSRWMACSLAREEDEETASPIYARSGSSIPINSVISRSNVANQIDHVSSFTKPKKLGWKTFKTSHRINLAHTLNH